MASRWIIRYSEIFLKSDPVRRKWENTLLDNILAVQPGCTGWTERGRLWIEGDVDPDRLRKVFGIVSFSRVEIHPLADLPEAILVYAGEHGIATAKSFAIRVKRVGKHDFNSQDKARDLGSIVWEAFPHLRVDLEDPDKELFVQIRDETCYLYDAVEKGAGGIPLGVEGTLVALVSGGIDSPVAAYMMMKRGCRIIPLYVRLRSYLDESNRERAKIVVETLREYQPDIELVVVEDDYLKSAKTLLAKKHLDKLTCIFCKRRMYRIAEAVAAKNDAKGIVTGESLGQVASQTLDNLLVLTEAATIPLYRPLIGFDKEETMKIAREIGTFKPSTVHAGGCKAVPKPPATRAKLLQIRNLEEELGPEIHRLPSI
ncbi:MAG: tRNA uracil 4-sulfurtransferase ThiI [Methanoregulaceae archaeon]